MNSSGKVDLFLAIRLGGAAIGAVGFILLAYQYQLLGTALIGIGSVIIAGAGGK